MFYTPRGKLIEVEKGFDVPSYVLSHTMRGQVSQAGGASDGAVQTLPRRRRWPLQLRAWIRRVHMLFPALSIALSLR